MEHQTAHPDAVPDERAAAEPAYRRFKQTDEARWMREDVAAYRQGSLDRYAFAAFCAGARIAVEDAERAASVAPSVASHVPSSAGTDAVAPPIPDAVREATALERLAAKFRAESDKAHGLGFDTAATIYGMCSADAESARAFLAASATDVPAAVTEPCEGDPCEGAMQCEKHGAAFAKIVGGDSTKPRASNAD